MCVCVAAGVVAWRQRACDERVESSADGERQREGRSEGGSAGAGGTRSELRPEESGGRRQEPSQQTTDRGAGAQNRTANTASLNSRSQQQLYR